MQKTNIKNYLLISGIGCVVLGIILLALLSTPARYVGVIFLIFAIVLIASSNYLNFRSSDEGKLRSRTREQLLKHQLKK
jgi:membrane protein implicated in regulation of membrane protease activity